MKEKIYSYLGFAQKSGNLVSGEDTCKIYGKKGKIKLLIIAQDISENGMKKALGIVNKYKIPHYIYGEKEKLSKTIGKHNRSIYGIIDKHFSEIIEEAIKKEMKRRYSNED